TGAGADFVPNWNARLNIGVRKNEVLGFDDANSTTSFTDRFSSLLPLPLGFRAYAFVNYMGPREIARGDMKVVLISDVGVRKSLMDKKVNLSVRLSDVFNQMQFSRTLNQPSFSQTSTYRRQSQYLSFSVSFIFGSLKDSGRGQDGESFNPDSGMDD